MNKYKVIKTYANSSRLFAIVEIKPDVFGWFYRSSGMNKKAGRTWGGDWFPILATNYCDSKELRAVRKAVFGSEKTKNNGDWINKNVSTNEINTFFTIRSLKEVAEELKTSLQYINWDDVDFEEHTKIYESYKNNLDNLFNRISELYNKIREEQNVKLTTK